MPEVKAKKNGKSKSKSPKKLSNNNKKKLPPSRRNEIWETMSDDLSETPSSPADVMDLGDEELSRCYSEELKDDDEVNSNIVDPHETTNSPSWRSVNNRIDMSGSIHSSEEFDPLNDDDEDDDDMDSAFDKEECGLPAAPFSSDSQKKTSEMSLKELKAELLAYDLSPEDFLEKNEMIKAVRQARKRHFKNNKTTPEDHTQRSRSVSISNEASSTRFEKQDKVIYKSSDGTKEVATILKIHLDDELVPFYDIRLVDSGKEKQTDDAHLSPISTNRQLSGQIPDSIAFSLDDDNEGEVGEYELGVSVQSPSYYDIEDAGDAGDDNDNDNDDDEYEEISHHSRTPLQNRRSLTASHRSAGTPTGHSGRARRSIETSGRNRNSIASAPAGMKRNSVQSSPHQNTKARGRNSDYHGSSSRRGSANSNNNMSPTRPPHLRHMSPTRPPARRSSTNTSSPTRPPSCRRRDSTDSNCYARPSSTRSSNNASPTRPSSSIRIGRRDSNENNNHRPSSIRTSHTSPTRPPPPIRSNGRPQSVRSTSPPPPTRSNGRPQSVRSTSPPPPRNNNATRHSSAPLSPTKSPIKNNNSKTKNLSPKRPTTTRKTDLSPKRPKASTTSPGNSNQPAPYGHSLKLLKKRMSS